MSPRPRACLVRSLAVAGLLLAAPARGAIMFNGTYTQDFDSLSKTANADVAWVDDQTILGWYSSESSYRVGDDAPGNLERRFFSFGTADQADRALGSAAKGSATQARVDVLFGARFVNKTGAAITDLDLEYRGEQWSSRDDNVQTLHLQFSDRATALTGQDAVGYVNLADGNFNSPKKGLLGKLDGNAAGNNATVSVRISNLNLAKDAEFWLRWQDFDLAGIDHGLGIDDLKLTVPAAAIPEPGGLALGLIGGTAVGLGWRARRRGLGPG